MLNSTPSVLLVPVPFDGLRRETTTGPTMNFTPRPARLTQESRRRHACSLALVSVSSSLALCLWLAGCASESGPDLHFRPDATQAAARGDWDDIDSAVIWGANNAEWVIHRWWSVDESTRCYDLRNPAGTTASLRIRREANGSGDALGLTASVGPLGDAAAEKRLIAVVERRLNQLHGVEVAELK